MKTLLGMTLLTAGLMLPALPVLADHPVEGQRSYPAYYRSGGSGFNYSFYRRGGNMNATGYSGGSGQINRPHRSTWQRQLVFARQELLAAQAVNRSNRPECGYSRSPLYCYKINGPYFPDVTRD